MNRFSHGDRVKKGREAKRGGGRGRGKGKAGGGALFKSLIQLYHADESQKGRNSCPYFIGSDTT